MINIEALSESELIDLNNRICTRIKALRAAKTQTAMRQFRPGQAVRFHNKYGDLITGLVIRVNIKTVSILTPQGDQWNVSPSVLVMDVDSEPGQVELLPRL